MKDGAWINAKTGSYRWVDEHARWVSRHPENAKDLGLSDDIAESLGKIPWDFNGEGRKAILLLAMGQGLIRARGHGAYITFEHTIPTEEAVLGTRVFMAKHLGPQMTCRFNHLGIGTSVEFVYGRVVEDLERGEVGFLVPPWKRAIVAPLVPRPYLLLENLEGTEGWTCWTLPDHLDSHGLVALLRAHVPEGSGWLALSDGRTWRLSPGAPPLFPLAPTPLLAPEQICQWCGWPTRGPATPCHCMNTNHCQCGVPRWPVPGKDIITLEGEVLHVPTFVGMAHRHIPWPTVRVLPFDDLIRRGR